MTAKLSKYGPYTNYRIPPESTGDRVAHTEYYLVEVDGVGLTPDEQAVFSTASGVKGDVADTSEFGARKRLILLLAQDSALTGFGSNEPITITCGNGTVQNGTVKSSERIMLARTGITDSANPNHHLAIDPLGAASVRFTEGEPLFDAYGQLRVLETSRLADYTFYYDTSPNVFEQLTTGSGTFSHASDISSVAFDCTTASGDSVTFTTHRYHRYTPGVAHFITMSVFHGDTGKAGVKRQWGYFDDRNGAYYELDGDTLYAVVRSNTSGSVVETRVAQTQWSNDRLDGSSGEANQSGMNLDVTKNNIYWIDFQWQGAGVVRFGTYSPAGRRVVAHVMQHANQNAGPYTSTASLPIRFAQTNVAGAASPSRMTVTSAAIFREGRLVNDGHGNNNTVRSWARSTPLAIDNAEYGLLLANRAAGTYAGKHNLRNIIPRFLGYHTDVDIEIAIYAATVFDGGATWTPAAYESAAEMCIDGTISVEQQRGIRVATTYISAGASRQEVSEMFNSLGSHLHAKANSQPGIVYSIWAKSLSAPSGSVLLSVDWVEV
jgi:hypothetical protein